MKTMNLTISYKSKTAHFPQLKELHMEGNDLKDLEHLTPKQFPKLRKLAIAKNRFSCEYLTKLLAQIWLDWPGLTLTQDSWQQKHLNCSIESLASKEKKETIVSTGNDNINLTTATEAQNTKPDTRLETKFLWLYSTIGFLVLIIIITALSICWVFRNRFFKKRIQHEYEVTKESVNANTDINMTSLSVSPDEHVYEEITYIENTYNHLQRDTDPKPISSDNHYDNHLLLAQRPKAFI